MNETKRPEVQQSREEKVSILRDILYGAGFSLDDARTSLRLFFELMGAEPPKAE